uniref:Uncharacterized protein n=1 Tax=Corethron hystrix TaxID=216773 RepID=A0A7S1FUL4_9STRA|mmetsp:Transcript_29763/g.68308  ORF Transcript_29763/g.68308 Transcript_29763/m.68308 type:complete len:311 (+) Transcript_29763:111-1043(+)
MSRRTAVIRIISRRSLLKMRADHEKRTGGRQPPPPPPIDETPWPKTLRIVGYAAAALSIPATAVTVLGEFPFIREKMIGERIQDSEDRAIAKKVVGIARWFWLDASPPDSVIPRAFENDRYGRLEDGSQRGWEEEWNLQSLLDERIVASVQTCRSDGTEHRTVEVEGRAPVTDLLQVSSEKETTRVELSFNDLPKEKIPHPLPPSSSDSVELPGINCVDSAVIFLTHTFPIWHTFDEKKSSLPGLPGGSGNVQEQKSKKDLILEELEWREAKLREELADLMSSRSIDDIEEDIKKVKGELRRVKRQNFFM